MRTPVRSSQFKRDVKKAEKRGKRMDKLCEGLTAYFLQVSPEEGARSKPAALWRGLKECEDTKALALYVETSLGGQDREYLLERAALRLQA